MSDQANHNQPSQGRELSREEREELRRGLNIKEMTATAGWAEIKRMLEDLAYHRWADPRETKSEKEWTWRELNTYYAASNAKELLEAIDDMIARADDLDAIQKGEIEEKTMRI